MCGGRGGLYDGGLGCVWWGCGFKALTLRAGGWLAFKNRMRWVLLRWAGLRGLEGTRGCAGYYQIQRIKHIKERPESSPLPPVELDRILGFRGSYVLLLALSTAPHFLAVRRGIRTAGGRPRGDSTALCTTGDGVLKENIEQILILKDFVEKKHANNVAKCRLDNFLGRRGYLKFLSFGDPQRGEKKKGSHWEIQKGKNHDCVMNHKYLRCRRPPHTKRVNILICKLKDSGILWVDFFPNLHPF